MAAGDCGCPYELLSFEDFSEEVAGTSPENIDDVGCERVQRCSGWSGAMSSSPLTGRSKRRLAGSDHGGHRGCSGDDRHDRRDGRRRHLCGHFGRRGAGGRCRFRSSGDPRRAQHRDADDPVEHAHRGWSRRQDRADQRLSRSGQHPTDLFRAGRRSRAGRRGLSRQRFLAGPSPTSTTVSTAFTSGRWT